MGRQELEGRAGQTTGPKTSCGVWTGPRGQWSRDTRAGEKQWAARRGGCDEQDEQDEGLSFYFLPTKVPSLTPCGFVLQPNPSTTKKTGA